MVTLKQSEINQLLNAQTKNPHQFLGINQLDQDNVVIRVFEPYAKRIFVESEFLDNEIELDLINDQGLFEKVIKSTELFDYKLNYEGYNEEKWSRKDSYSFAPILSDYDLYLFSEGNHHRVYDKMGAHVITNEGVEGASFTVWAPEAERVSVIGSFNNWDGRVHQMRMLGHSGVWEIFIPHIKEGDLYRFEILTKEEYIVVKSDPYAFYTEMRPANASIVYDYNGKYEWEDQDWMEKRSEINWLEEPISVYEVNLASWARVPEEENRFLTYKELADKLVDYVKDHNYTHVELMPIAEHPLDESWGYQVTGYFSTTSRFGKPEDLMYLIDEFHKNDIGVILDWVPGHFPKDPHGLGRFDGSALYEHLDPRLGEHQDWGTYIFNYGRNEVKNFLISNALYWLDKFHIDGLRVDAVASMVYLDYSREEGEWIPNKYGGRENLEAIEFLQYFNSITHEYYPGILTIAEESTAFEGVSKPTYLGGLGFSMKWNMGWMNDSLEYIEKDPIYRKYHHNNLTFPLVYAFNENFMLVLSHDEVVHGKGSMINKMPGDYWQKFANLRLFYSYMFAHPGKNLLFMGGDFGQWKEWKDTQSLDWNLLEYEPHQKLLDFIRDLNSTYQVERALWEIDFSYDGFEWISCDDVDNSVLSFVRKGKEPDELIVCVFNFTPMERHNYRLGVPKAGYYEEILNTDAEQYWGSNLGNMGGVWSESIPWQDRADSISVTLPPLGGLYFKYKK
ncbi:1,4-alpha-glucan branching protein GlgB [Orenia marismortui]|uniref:1,4-alpha-glucan branching enzyme GlgB n=1 Tax=Orenia marismortui TaxID=46469 RepID=A0A4R8H5A3_9FIRM|nr:1,4-alpha-glucan branching protein GlgB [Orenia marismortui]TDX52339.1 1,4-alpha-glucan branching enzyme [Orenia marismortui]